MKLFTEQQYLRLRATQASNTKIFRVYLYVKNNKYYIYKAGNECIDHTVKNVIAVFVTDRNTA